MKKHQGDTDKVQKIKLDSSIEQVLWTKKSSSPGGKAGLEVLTQFVGNNSEISIQLSDKSGKTFETIKKKMFGNKFWTEITVPEKAEEQLFAEVKLSKLCLSKKSNPLNLLPTIEIKNLKWDRDEVHRGDIVKITADITNVYDGAEAEVQIWEHDSDNAHDFIASIPVIVKNKKIEADWEFQYVDDTDDIPTQEESEKGYKWPEYFFRAVCGGKSANSKLLKFKDWVEIEVKDKLGIPITNKDYKLLFPDGTEKEGKLTEEGKIRIEDLPPGKIKFQLVKNNK